MNDKTAKILAALNNDFYLENGESFARPREVPWPGWQRCLDVFFGGRKSPGRLSVLDLACGNLRFAKFLAAALPQVAIDFYAVDNCDALAGGSYRDDAFGNKMGVHYQNLDILNILFDGAKLTEHIAAHPSDITVCFGFMHHVPGQKLRADILAALLEQTRPGGYIAISFWQFMSNTTLRKKAEATHAAGIKELASTGLLPEQLDAGDYLLGWQDRPGKYRYCHSFSESEIDELLAAVAAKTTQITRFTADGRTGDLNTYIVLRVND
jgi:SAM-dependent methyltransferase